MSDRLAEIEARLNAATPKTGSSDTFRFLGDVRDLLAVAKAARALDGVPITDDTVVVPQSDGVVEMPLTWGYLLADLRAALANLEGGA